MDKYDDIVDVASLDENSADESSEAHACVQQQRPSSSRGARTPPSGSAYVDVFFFGLYVYPNLMHLFSHFFFYLYPSEYNKQ